ncbi:MAG: flagellar protein FliS [Alphaproteobacteria bacterium]|nr:flagellar protein FliS [Alphaproteobacteria bacterium]
MYSKGIAAYQTAKAVVSPSRQIILLYEGMIKHIQQAKAAILEKRIEDRYNALDKAGKIAMGLLSAVDFDIAPELAKALQRFYISLDVRFLHVQRSNDIKVCDQLIKEINEMKKTWEAVDAEQHTMQVN